MINVRDSIRRQQSIPPDAAPAAERKPSKHIRSRPLQRDTWLDRMIAETGLLTVALAFWGLNAVFTMQGLAALGVPLWGGFVIHITISKSETYLLYRWRDPWYLLLLIVAMSIDVMTTLVGSVPIVAERLPWVLNGAPTDVLSWTGLFHTPTPDWWANASIVLVMSGLVALASERMVRHFWRGVCETWNEYGR